MLAALGKTLLKGKAKKIAKDKLLNRKKKTNKRRMSVKKIMGMDDKQKKDGALAVRPTRDLVGNIKDFDPVSDTSGESDIVIIKKQVIQVRDILKDTRTAKQAERMNEKKRKQTDKRTEREDKLEKPKVEPKEAKSGMKMPNLGLGIGNFLTWLIAGLIFNKLKDLMPALKKIFGILKPIVNFIGGVLKKTLEFVIGFIDLSYAGVEKLREGIVAIGGEGAGELFDKFGKLFTQFINAGLIAALIGARVGLFSGIISKVAGGIFGGGATASAVTTGVTAGGVTVTTSGGAAAGGLTGSTAATAGGVGAGAAAGIVAGVGLLASGLGEGAFQLTKMGDGFVDYWRKSYEEKKWFDPRKAIDFGIFKIMQTLNLGLGNLGVLLDIIGAPFRYLIELVRYPFLDEAGKAKQRENLAKFDARIREQFRETLNFFTLGLAFKEKGSFGSIYGKEGTEKMGYTETDEVTNKKADEVLSIINNNVSSEGLETYPSYDEAGGGTTTYVVSQKGSSGGEETSSGTNAEVTKMSEGLILSGSGGESNNSYDVLAKR